MPAPSSARRWEQVQDLFDRLVKLNPERRAAGLDDLRREDPGLFHEVESLLEADAQVDEILCDLELLRQGPSGAARPPSEMPRAAPTDPYGVCGTTVAHYAIDRPLGAGGMGIVYEARDTRLKRKVALKFLPLYSSDDPDSKARFIHEAQAASALDHPNICTIHEIGETEEGQLFIAMARYEGETLKAKLARGPLSVEAALDWAIQTARGMLASHAAGIIHRDVKPANIMITEPVPDVSPGVVKILDFGLAKVARVRLTKTGALMGTVDYMSPEHARGEEIDPRADVWSLGVVLFEMLSGERPFDGATDEMVIYSILHDDPAPLRDLAPDVPEGLEDVIATCLQKDPDRRYRSMTELIEDLESLVAAGVSGSGTGLRAQRRRRRRRAHRAMLGTGVLILAALAVTGLSQLVGPGPARLDLVVLPFANVGGDPARQPFVDGLVHTVTSTLAAMERIEDRISVVPALDVLEAAPLTTTAASVKFGVDLAITGAVRHADDRVVLDVRLVDARAGRQRRSRRIEVPRASLAGLPDSMVRAFTELLELDLDAGARRAVTVGGTATPSAYDFYTEGRGHLLRYEDQREIDRAIELLQAAIEEDSSYVLAYAALGEAYWRKYAATGDPTWVDEAVRYGRRAVALDEDLAPAQVSLGLIYKGTGQFAEGVRTLERALALHPGNAFTHGELAWAYYFQDSFDLAIEHARKAIELRPDYGDFHAALGFLYHAQGRHEEAMGPYRRAAELAPDNPWHFNDLAAQFELTGDYQEAARWYEEALQADPANREAAAYAYGNLGGIAYRSGDLAEAVRWFEEAYRADSLNTAAWINLPDAYFWAGRTERARGVLRRVVELEQRALEINPKDTRSLHRLAKALAMTGQAESARGVLDRLEALGPTDPRVLFGMSRTFEYLGDRDGALRHFEQALQNGLSAPAIEFHAISLENLRSDARYRALVRRYLGEAAGSALPGGG